MFFVISLLSILMITGFALVIHAYYTANEGFEDEDGCQLVDFAHPTRSHVEMPAMLVSGEAFLLK